MGKTSRKWILNEAVSPPKISQFNVDSTAEKTTPADDDRILVDDSEDSYAKKWIKHSSLIGSAVASYAELYEDDDTGTQIDLDTSGTWYKWVSATAGNDTGSALADADGANNKIIIGTSGAGPYFIEAFFAGEVSSAAELGMAVFLNGSKSGGGLETSDTKGSAQSLDLSCSGILDLANTDYLEIKFKSDQTNLDLTVKRLNVSLFRMAGGRDGNRWHSGSGVPSGSLGNINDYYLNTANGDLYKKTGVTTWVSDGNIKGPTGNTGPTGPAGMDWEGAWDSGTTYAVDDAVIHSGTSYICTAGHSNQEPPNASYWDILASKGDTGSPPASSIDEATASDATSSSSYVLSTGMTETPAAGTYLVWFSGYMAVSAKGKIGKTSIYSNGTLVTSSVRTITVGGIGYEGSFCCVAKVTVNGSQAIEGKFATSGGTITLYERSLLIMATAA